MCTLVRKIEHCGQMEKRGGSWTVDMTLMVGVIRVTVSYVSVIYWGVEHCVNTCGAGRGRFEGHVVGSMCGGLLENICVAVVGVKGQE